MGPGAAAAKRVKWSKQLTDEQAKPITVETVLRGDDQWNPIPIARGLMQSSTTRPVSGEQ
jgi:hypothetical protein